MAKKKATPITSLSYVGTGHITGIPARDLNATDLNQLTADQIKHCIESGLYTAKKKETDPS